MKKKWKYVIMGVCFAVVICLSVCLAIFLPKDTKADDNFYNASFLSDMTAAETGADVAPVSDKGGAIYLSNGATFDFVGGRISGHHKKYGGAVYVGANSTFNMTGGIITGNTASYGGAIYVANGGK